MLMTSAMEREGVGTGAEEISMRPVGGGTPAWTHSSC